MKLPELKIGHLVAKVPIIQGGMAIRISTARLAAAVAEQGGIGLIAASGMPFDELRHEIRLARSLTKGIIGINAMVAAREFAGLVRTAIEEGIDLVVAGAGFSRDIFAIGKESGTPIVPIVSSAKLARISESLGASAVIVEGKEAGGHLGTDQSVRTLLPEIKKAVKIPVIGAGGVISGRDIVELLSLGADGVQMGTRFAASVESNAAPALKEFYLKAKPEDVVLIKSPVGLPGQAVKNPFATKILEGTAPLPDSCDACLKHCERNFCIIKALIRAQQGDVETGLVFTGEYIHKIDEILPVKEIFSRLLKEVEEIK
ncbi:NAD(P)H-dependent flavin oxidoreductase YrpB (nitropropane dioxygenase family) [Anaerospora hongkongensis]|uniref:Probable nitronate monooxygenase n=1 Tax=Anaerospora hongkongensis TaxID=244830 RepID=A0A4R1QB90_9FIRM|nr:nitronate monooxygenase [Anaerospora hongkongensis]TCL40225.1 NAD(P)H-dependent flavin oxidoreductase YrpB (nitropropane dioxygenase family) [Anaerospora hongkongensis]